MRSSIRGAIRGVLRAIRRFRTLVQGDPRKDIATTYLSGSGIEIGALHNPLAVPAGVKVRYLDRMSVEDLRRHYPELEFEPLTPVDIIDDGERLSTLDEATQDFVIANHFLEHCENPLEALKNMIRVLRPGGVLYLAVPDKRFTFDRDRPVTPLEHISKDFVEGPEQSRRQHYEEWVNHSERKMDRSGKEQKTKELMDQRYSIHFHVWTSTELLELFSSLDTLLGMRTDLELFMENRDEVLAVVRKGS